MEKNERRRGLRQEGMFIENLIRGKSSGIPRDKDDCFKISFKHLDRNQGEDHFSWEEKKMLGLAMDTLTGYCARSLRSQLNQKFTVYGTFPSADKTEFIHPRHVPKDAEWARIHVNGTHCLIGHVVENIFYLVFYDAEHKFWKSALKHT
jgi:hypothetical protein